MEIGCSGLDFDYRMQKDCMERQRDQRSYVAVVERTLLVAGTEMRSCYCGNRWTVMNLSIRHNSVVLVAAIHAVIMKKN